MPELAVLSVLAHPDDVEVAVTAVVGGILPLRDVAGGRARLYHDLVVSAVSAAVRAALEALMEKYEYKSDFARKYFAEGQAEGEAKGELVATRGSLLRVLARRGFAVSAEQRERIESETDLARLERWHDVAVTAASLAEVFTDA